MVLPDSLDVPEASQARFIEGVAKSCHAMQWFSKVNYAQTRISKTVHHFLRSGVVRAVNFHSSGKRRFKLLWCEAGPPNHHDDKVDSDQKVVNKVLSR